MISLRFKSAVFVFEHLLLLIPFELFPLLRKFFPFKLLLKILAVNLRVFFSQILGFEPLLLQDLFFRLNPHTPQLFLLVQCH